MLQSVTNNFKFRDLKVYSSTEWLADNKKKYRQVFTKDECSYIYAEFSFFNKLFDQADWEIDLELRCYQVRKNRKLLSVIPVKRFVSKYDPVVYVREGWGNKRKGSLWRKGTYCWEAYQGEKKIASRYFYIEDYDSNLSNQLPFLKVQSIKLYEGAYDDIPDDKRNYCRIFDANETRYIYVEMQFENKHIASPWQCELFVKFYNDARELKGQVVRLQSIGLDEKKFKVTAGWGSNIKGAWRKDRYTAELVFMDKLIAVIPFEVSDTFETGNPGMFLPSVKEPLKLYKEDEIGLSFEKLMSELDALTGLHAIKQKIREHAHFINFLKLRKEKGFPEEELPFVHAVFIGNPGTGKTTVAGMMGRLYQQMGILSKGHVHEVDRIDLIGEYIGQTAPKVKEAIEKARGGVLFIDEAYALARTNDDSKDFGREVIEILVREMSNGPGDLAVIVAGYPKEMEHFLQSNPGLKSRFKLYFEFSDYLPQELLQIAEYACHQKQVVLDPEAKELVNQVITGAYRSRDRSFGNARFVYDLIDNAKMNLGLRIMADANPQSFEKSMLETVIATDIHRMDRIKPTLLPSIPIDEDLLTDALSELDNLIGLSTVKCEIHETIELVKYYRYTGKDVLGSFFMHSILVGNPGTGKTTVARILTKIYKALGILERGHVVETDRQGLVAGYVGQTALKTSAKIDEAIGGVLFIDEAYALTQNNISAHGDFGAEAIQTLIKRMEDDRGKFFVFAAGYPQNMDHFLIANPGFKSRFDKFLSFEDYSPDDLFRIACSMFTNGDLKLNAQSSDLLQHQLSEMYALRDGSFGNARAVRNLVDAVIKKHHLRLSANLDGIKKSQDVNVIIAEDMDAGNVSGRDRFYTRPSIGFRGKAGN